MFYILINPDSLWSLRLLCYTAAIGYSGNSLTSGWKAKENKLKEWRMTHSATSWWSGLVFFGWQDCDHSAGKVLICCYTVSWRDGRNDWSALSPVCLGGTLSGYPIQRTASCSTHSWWHHHWCLVLCTSSASCRQGHFRFLLLDLPIGYFRCHSSRNLAIVVCFQVTPALNNIGKLLQNIRWNKVY